jgi:bifunctional non-homologous end joining protein LigD
LNILDSLKEKYSHLSANIHFAETWYTPAEKRAAFERIKQQKKEGMVFKLKVGTYEDGQPNSGGEALKFKLWESVTVVVSKVNAGRSVGISMHEVNDFGLVPVGNVTIPANFNMPQLGDFVEIRYLYVTNIGGSLYQPVYKGE